MRSLTIPTTQRKGHLDLIKYLDKEINFPTTGLHRPFVDAIDTRLFTEDVYFLVQEVYNGNTYMGSLCLIDSGGFFWVLPDNSVRYIGIDWTPIFTMNTKANLYVVTSGGILDLSPVTPLPDSYSLYCFTRNYAGRKSYHVGLIKNSGDMECEGELTQRIFEDLSTATTYRIRVQSDERQAFTIKGTRNHKTEFFVVFNKIQQLKRKITYFRRGEVRYIDYTPDALESCLELEKKGIITVDTTMLNNGNSPYC